MHFQTSVLQSMIDTNAACDGTAQTISQLIPIQIE